MAFPLKTHQKELLHSYFRIFDLEVENDIESSK